MKNSGSRKMKVPLSMPDISKQDRGAVARVLKTPYLSLGPVTRQFEERIADYTGLKYAAAVNSGTSGLHLIIRAMGIKKGDEVITSPFSFISSANCIIYEGAKPVFVDIRPDTLNIDVDRVEEKITSKTKAILAVDVFAHPAQWDKLRRIAEKHGLKLIEDSAEALGSKYKGKMCGSFADAAVFSFYPNKQITAGEGGIIVSNNLGLIELCRSMANQGRRAHNGKWLEHIQLGYNYRLSDISASLAMSQLSRINEIIRKRQAVAGMYNDRLNRIAEVSIPFVGSQVKMSWFVYVIRLSESYSGLGRDRIIIDLAGRGIQCGEYFRPIHLQPFYRKNFGYKIGSYPVCESIAKRTIALPFHNNLNKSEIDFVVKTLKEALKNARE